MASHEPHPRVRVHRISLSEIPGMRDEILRKVGRTYNELLDAERDYALTELEEIALSHLRDLDFLSSTRD